MSDSILRSKEEYHSRLASKLNNPKTSAKTYWSILKTFYNGKKIPVIPPILINNQLITNFKDKARYFNEFFSEQCSPLSNTSEIPKTQSFITNDRLSDIQFQENDIIKIIRSLDINKAHGHNDISIHMIKICDMAIVKPLFLIFQKCLKDGVFPDIWKKSNVVPIHKKGDKQLIQNYRSVSIDSNMR